MLGLLAALLIGAPAGGDPETSRGLAKIAILQGTMEISGAPQAPKVGDEVDAGATIKTPAGGRATLDYADGSELRINENSEVVIEGPRKVDLKKGKILLKVAKTGTRFEIVSEYAPVFTEGGIVEVQFVPKVPNEEPAHTYIRVLEGMSRATSKKFNANVSAGYQVDAYGSQLNTPDPLRNGSLETAWIHPLLVERGRMDEETTTRATELLQILGREAVNDPAEAALRSLGDLGTSELQHWLSRSAGAVQLARRTAAVRIIAETGTMKSAAALVSLLQHPEPEVRVIAAQGLARLAGGKDLGFNETFWKGETRDAGQKAWEDWLKQNSK
jgi:hypothetical protein